MAAEKGTVTSSLVSLAAGGLVLGVGIWWLLGGYEPTPVRHKPLPGQYRKKIKR